MAGSRESEWHVMRRCLAILVRLQCGSATGDELAGIHSDMSLQEIEAARRRFKGDRQRIREHLAGEIAFDRKSGLYHLEHLGLPLVDLPESVRRSLALLRDAFVEGAPMSDDVQQLLAHIVHLMPAESQRQIPSSSPVRLHITAVDDDAIPDQTLAQIQYVCRHRQEIEFDYYSPSHEDGQPRHNHVRPLEHVFEDGHHYLRGFCLRVTGPKGDWDRLSVQAYRIGRITNLKLLPQHFPPDAYRELYHDLVYVLEPKLARGGVSQRIPHSQVTYLPDGRARVDARSLDLFRDLRTLLRYGPGCRVIGGDEAVRQMREMVRKMAETYMEI